MKTKENIDCFLFWLWKLRILYPQSESIPPHPVPRCPPPPNLNALFPLANSNPLFSSPVEKPQGPRLLYRPQTLEPLSSSWLRVTSK
ncbi:hypothetical protein PoB_007523600 [Plakobranchus ocellatus]|uniref:Uncharacterized protein n=1 Tax=Plakobranchus ocellatus TaxID=259542 RepID=A0AAV4DXY7_9GAST|nr:hypothetical protein PoB_007523600 [Plakobranchus ocellatus]